MSNKQHALKNRAREIQREENTSYVTARIKAIAEQYLVLSTTPGKDAESYLARFSEGEQLAVRTAMRRTT